MTRFTARHADPAVNIAGELAQDIVSVYGDNRTIFWTHRISRLPVVVTQKVPFNIQIVQPGVPIVRNGMMELKVRATREAGFAEPIALKMLWNPPGIGSGQAIIAKDQSETTIHLDCNGGAPILKWPVVVIGTATVGNGPVEVSTQLAALDVSDMWVEFAVDKTRAEQGKGAELAVKVVKKRDFPGEARAELLGLPVKTSAGAQTVTKETAELKYAIQTAPDAPPGRYGNLFIRATIVENGESIVHQSGSGLLMIDAPLPPKPAEEAKPAEKPKKRRRPAPVTLGDWRIPCTPEFALAC
jgi:hypothetical protein